MQVLLLAHTPEPARLVAAAARLCYSKLTPSEVYEGLTDEKVKKLLTDIRASGHMSPFEHVSFTFGVSGLSRVASHQLVRHRMASFSQQSQRYVSMKDNSVVVPPSAESDPERLKLYEEAAELARGYYNRLVEMGMDKEDARFILPHGGYTNLIFTMNARELMHFFRLRLCRRAQWEIRELAIGMLELVLDAAPELFLGAGPACMADGKCPEPVGRCCGKPCSKPENAEQMLEILRKN